MAFLVVSVLVVVAVFINGATAQQCKSHQECVNQTNALVMDFMKDYNTNDANSAASPARTSPNAFGQNKDEEAIGYWKKEIDEASEKIKQRAIHYRRAIKQLEDDIAAVSQKYPELSPKAKPYLETLRVEIGQMEQVGPTS